MAKSSIMMLALLSLCLSGCNSLYYPEPIDGMTIRVHVHDDAQALWDACGKMVEACALVRARGLGRGGDGRRDRPRAAGLRQSLELVRRSMSLPPTVVLCAVAALSGCAALLFETL